MDSSSYQGNIVNDEVIFVYIKKIKYQKVFDSEFVNDVVGKPKFYKYLLKKMNIILKGYNRNENYTFCHTC